MSKSKDLMGYDPLEWLREESGSSTQGEPPVELPVAAQESPAPAPPTEAVTAAAEAPLDPVLDLGSSLQIMDVAQLKPRLEEYLQKLKEITLRADEGLMIDGAGMQLLLAFVLQAQHDGVRLRWESLPPPLVEAARLLACEQVLLDS